MLVVEIIEKAVQFKTTEELVARILEDAKSTSHSPLGASSLYRWSKCPGSVRLIKESGVKQTPSQYAEEGTIAHGFLAYVLKGLAPLTLVPEADGMRDAVQYALSVLRSEIALTFQQNASGTYDEVGFSLFEQGFDLSSIYPGVHGTADAVIYQPETKTLLVSDYKHGSGKCVEVEGNVQLLTYALGAYLSLKKLSTINPKVNKIEIKRIRLQIIQPRFEHPSGSYARNWDIEPFDLLDFAGEFRSYAEATSEQNAPLVPGEHCDFCPGIAICPALRRKAMEEAVETFKGIDVEKVKPSSQQLENLKKALDFIPLLKKWMSGVESYAYGLANSGVKVPGYKLVEKRATRKWKDEAEIVAFLKKHNIPEENYLETKVKTPPALEKALELKKKQMAVLEPYIVKQSSGSTLVAESDSRQALEKGPKNVFGLVEGE